ncbi:polysaccharide pyruvyl transferase family protein [Leucobacter salsicius]|uniref:polysaccharide pyruvyl transferase family protein n=1 Tax=Leucobacter salsicius TaxID=664638 RepID=UPI0003495603|nr:polysaccharide pyruvyl transferase family protein [Leucobacter salsicius]
MSKTKILLLTNRDSDNVGDQLIEASVISLIQGAMQNLDIAENDYSIESRAAGIISKKYMRTRDPLLLEPARKLIASADILIFGGSPLFNYSYQNFYLRTIKTLELAQEYDVPVIFSSIGVEEFDPENPKCLQLKEALKLPCVRQITTRDDFSSLEKYVEGSNIPIGHVADPVVLADIIFRKEPPAPAPAPPKTLRSRAKSAARQLPIPAPVKAQLRSLIQATKNVDVPTPVTTPAEAAPRRKRIGLVAVREGIFKDNGIDFPAEAQSQFWLETMARLAEEGYDVRIFTTGHFADEVFLDTLVRAENIPASQAAVVINSPEGLIKELSACDGVIAFRLHANITSYALGIPSIGLNWNEKVPLFYESVGYGERAFDATRWNIDQILPALETAMSEGVVKDEAFLSSVYGTLFVGLKKILSPESKYVAYSPEQLKSSLPRYAGTSAREYQVKARNKLRRTYESYQKQLNRIEKYVEGSSAR